MPSSTNYSPAVPGLLLCPLASLSAERIAAASGPGSSLHFDGSALPYQRTLGVCHQVSQLLLLHRAGFSISLHHPNPVLRRCLRQLQVTQLFSLVA